MSIVKKPASNIRFLLSALGVILLLYSSSEILGIKASRAFAESYPERITVEADGVLVERDVYIHPGIHNQRYVLFSSGNRQLAPDILLDDDQGSNLFVYDRVTGDIEIVSVTSEEKQAHRMNGAYGGLSNAYASEDYRYVVFASGYVDLVPNDTNRAPDVFLRDRVAGTTKKIGEGFSDNAKISPDGRYITFYSWSPNLVENDTNQNIDIFVYDALTEEIELASVSPNGEQSVYGVSEYELSPDGKFLIFSASGFPGVPDENNYTYIRNLTLGTTEILDININGNLTRSGFGLSFISSGGRFGAINYGGDVYFFDRTTGAAEKISAAMGGGQADGDSKPAGISDDGRFVLFSSSAKNLTPDITNSNTNLYLRDRESGVTKLINVASDGTPSNEVADHGYLNKDGKFISFRSRASNLVANDNNNEYDTFITNNPFMPVNYSPVIDQISGAPNPLQANTQISMSASFTDLESTDTHTAVWEWADGTTSTGTVTESSGSGTITGSHTYATDGDYTVVLTLTDSAGNKAYKSFKIIDPTPAQTDYKWTKVIQTTSSNSEDSIGIEKMATDSDGNKYLAGSWRGTVDFDPGAGTDVKTTSAGTPEMFITKINADDSYAWTKNTSQDPECQNCSGGIYNLAIDAQDNINLIGSFQHEFDFGFGGVSDKKTSSSPDHWDIGITKLDSDGTYVNTNTIPMSQFNENLNDINMDSAGNIYLAGRFQGSVDFDPGPSEDIRTTQGDNQEMYITKINPDTSYAWTKTVQNGFWDMKLAFDSSNNVYITGNVSGREEIDFDPGPGTDLISNAVHFTTKIMSDGSYGWTETINNYEDRGGSIWSPGIAVDSESNVYITGAYQYSLDFDPNGNSENIPDAGGEQDTLFVTKYNSNGSYGWTRAVQRLGGLSVFKNNKLAFDSRNNVYIAGGFSGKIDFNPPYGNIIYKNNQAYITGYSKNGNYLGTKTTTATIAEGIAAASNIVIDKNNNLYVSGEFSNKIDFNPYSGKDFITGYADQNGRYNFISKYDLSLSNKPTEIDPITLSPAPLLTYIQATANSAFRDQDTTDIHTAVWDWGDGMLSNGTVSESGGSGTVSGAHTYTEIGAYTVKLTITDSFGNVSIKNSQPIAVESPTPAQMADIIVDTVSNSTIPANVESSYMSNLKKVEEFIADGKINSARNQIESFINKVEKDYEDGLITQTQRDQFLDMANAILEDLN